MPGNIFSVILIGNTEFVFNKKLPAFHFFKAFCSKCYLSQDICHSRSSFLKLLADLYQNTQHVKNKMQHQPKIFPCRCSIEAFSLVTFLRSTDTGIAVLQLKKRNL